MKTILISGPPASGKFTVAKELSKISSYKVFHNHFFHDLVTSTLDYEKYRYIIHKLSLYFLSLITKENVNIIMTHCYSKKRDYNYLLNLYEIIVSNGGLINFVRLKCDYKELQNRVTKLSRKQYLKVNTIEELDELISLYNYDENPFLDTLVIDNTKTSAKKVASIIKKSFNII